MLTKVAGSLVGLGMAALLGYKKWTCLEHHEEVDGVRSSKTTLKPCPFHDHKKVPHHRVRLYGHLPKSSETGLRAHIHDERKNWNFNWDSRDPAEIYSKAEGPINECKIPYKSRHIYLVRHGEYNQDNEHDALRNLTEKGKEQATLAGKRLQELGLTFDKIIISTMTRARETGDCILKELPPEMTEKVVTTDLLREGLPASSEPKSDTSFVALCRFLKTHCCGFPLNMVPLLTSRSNHREGSWRDLSVKRASCPRTCKSSRKTS
ncbi:serine/threonine-protein phosphatase Pgam5, mitochondrial-like isoform X2 [Varroa jacobsoni]|nr:serine/threonine-protein phosphatase Pgam5, mitochondrial-like isoform X2 [Varroa jacobsoni]